MVEKRIKRSFNVRIPYVTWKFLKTVSRDQERSMNDVVTECIEKYRKRLENRLTESDTMVS